MICCQFIFRPGTYDDEFHALDDAVAVFARSLPGFMDVERWQSPDGSIINAAYYFRDLAPVRELSQFPEHLTAKSRQAQWYDGYRIVVSEVVANYGDGRLPHVTAQLS